MPWPGVLEQGHAVCHGELAAVWKTTPGMLQGPGRAGIAVGSAHAHSQVDHFHVTIDS